MPHASDMRFVKLYMLAISTTSHTSSSVSPKLLRRSRSSGSHSKRSLGDLDSEVENGGASLVEAGPPVIQRDAVGEDGVAQGFPQSGSVGDQAVEAAVRHRDGDGDHLPLRRVQVGCRLVQLPVMGEPGRESLGTVAVSPEDVGDEPDALPRFAK